MGSVVDTPVRENFDRGMVHAKSILDRAILLRILCPHTEARAVLWDAMMTFPEAPSRHVQLRAIVGARAGDRKTVPQQTARSTTAPTTIMRYGRWGSRLSWRRSGVSDAHHHCLAGLPDAIHRCRGMGAHRAAFSS